MLEIHPFGDFVPSNAKYLILGSFPGKIQSKDNDWFYGSPGNQFWPIIEKVYGNKLSLKRDKQKLFSKLGIAVSDIIYQCERKRGSNLDNNLINIVYNIEGINVILKSKEIEKIYFTSKFVEKKFRKVFNYIVLENTEIYLTTLPSPSPRYAALTKSKKTEIYKKLLPT